MSLLDKQFLLRDIEMQLGYFVPANDVQRIMKETYAILERYDINLLPEDGPDKDSEDLLRYFLEAKRTEGRSELTLARYAYVLSKAQEAIGVPMSKTTVYHIRSYLNAERERGLADSAINGKREVINSFYRWLKREDLIEKDPTTNIAPIIEEDVVRLPFTDVELTMLDEAARTLRDRAIVAFLTCTGCRASETCKLNRDDIDWEQKCVIVHGKGKKQRRVYLDDVTIMRIRMYLDSRKDDDDALFRSKRGGHLTRGGLGTMIRLIGSDAGVPKAHPHRFRRTMATNKIKRGMPIQQVSKLMGHSKIDTTMTYVYIDDSQMAESFRRFS